MVKYRYTKPYKCSPILTKNLLTVFVFIGFSITSIMKESSTAVVSKMNTSDDLQGSVRFSNNTVAEALGFYFFGYIMSQLIGSFLARRFDGSLIFALGVLVNSFLTLFGPSIVHWGEIYLMNLRFVQGIFEGLLYPSSQEICSYWAPVRERSRMISFVLSSSYFGTFLWLVLKDNVTFTNGLHTKVDITGAVGLVYSGLFLILILVAYYRLPDSYHQRRSFVQDSSHVVPLMKLLCSPPVWAIVCVHSAADFGYFMVMTNLPSFLRHAGYSQHRADIFSACLYFTMTLTMVIAGALSDCVVNRKIISVITVRKCFVGLGLLMQTIFLVCLALDWSSGGATLVVVILAMAFQTFARVGFFVNMLDFALHYSSITMSLSNTFATMTPGILTCLLTAFAPDSYPEERVSAFWASSLMNIVALSIYTIHSSAEDLPWVVSNNVL